LGKGVSTIIAAIFVIMIFMLIFIYLAFTMRNFGDIANKFVEIVNEAATRERESLRVTYVIANNIGIYLGLRNEGIVTSIIKGYSIRDLSNNQVWYGTFTNPYTIPPGGSVDIHIPGSYRQDAAYLIALVTEVGNVVRTKYPQPVTNVTRACLLKQQLQTIAGEGTVTWAGKAIIPVPKNITSNITYAEVNNEPVSNPEYLKTVDGNNVSIESIAMGVVELLENNTLLYEDFTSNPIGVTFITNTDTWEWRSTYGYENGGIYQSSENTKLTASGEIMGYFNNVQIPSQKVYIAVKTNHSSVEHSEKDGWADVILYDVDRNSFYTLGTNVKNDRIGISLNHSSQFKLRSKKVDIPADSWLVYHVTYDPNVGFMSISVHDIETISFLGSLSATDTLISPLYIGLGTYAEDAYFDDVLISLGDTRFVNVTNVPEGYTVELWSNGVLVNRSVSSGADSPVVLDVTYNYSLKNAYFIIRDKSGKVVAYTSYDLVLGGNVYTYKPTLIINLTTVTKSDVPYVKDIYVCTALALNVSSNVTISIYDFNTKMFNEITSLTNVNNVNQCFYAGSAENYVNATNNSVINLVIKSQSPVVANIDMFNTLVTHYVPLSKDTLIVGVGGTPGVDVYELGFNGVNLTLRYVKSLNVYSLFDGSTDVTYDSDFTMSLIVVNSSGVYSASLYSGKFSVINDSSPYFPSPGLVSVRAEVLDGYLLVVRGFTNGNDYLLIDLFNGNIVENGSLGVNISCTKYCVSASDGSNAYLLVLNASMGKPVIMHYSLGSGWEVLTNFTGYKSTGMCFGNGYLYVMLEMGGLYRVSVSDGSYELLNVNLPFYPRGFGDRLEYHAGNLIFVRDDDTTEVWVISPVE